MESDHYRILGLDLDPDHYQILSVSSSADADTIKQALRRKAMENHPDRGGTIEAMQRINFAWEILSNPDKRSRYDALRANPQDVVALASANADYAQARPQAENYPKTWNEYESWLDGVGADFRSAKYGETELWKGGFRIPTVENSLSGCLFILVGAGLAGWLIGVPVFRWICNANKIHPGKPNIIAFGVAGVCLLVGAWLGRWLHEGFGGGTVQRKNPSTTTNTPSSTPVSASQEQLLQHCIVSCNTCHQKMRVPRMQQELIVTCVKCHNKFTCTPTSAEA